MKNLLLYISGACFAFTFSTIVYSLFRFLGIYPPLTEHMTLSMLVISIIITILIFLSHQLPIENPIWVYVLEASCVMTVMIVAGAFFDLYPFGLYNVVTAVLVGFIAYGSVIVLIYLHNKADELKINHTILQRRNQDANDY
ncbi:hypothetical protein CSV74_00715 [Sporosarcina sp. P19]|uniref:DUF3021 family protein n=1 Tax=Sporosarcina sp. P19 TaxID=2048258 RepID=UPI000C164F9D|nr:DUF3021 family protein [Sporosarcina sp. P19]PIC78081.1 hypothetical protein CSV74_00715 [Sporosarcina sp. P19]